MTMRTIPAAEFKARCLVLMENVRKTREPVVITKRGKPVAKLVPVDNSGADFIGRLKGIVESVGDIESPIEGWETSQ